MQGMLIFLCSIHQKNKFFVGTSTQVMNDRYSKLAFLHRVKERKTPSLSAQASFTLILP